MKRRVGALLIGLLILVAGVFLLGFWRYADSPQLDWRLSVVRLKILGALPEESWSQVLHRIGGSRSGAMGTRGMRIANPLISRQDVEAGEQLYEAHCALCHGGSGEGLAGPSLTRPSFQTRADDAYIYWTITRGVPDTEMAPFRGSAVDALQLTAFVRSMGNAIGDGSQSEEWEVCAPCRSIDVTYDRLRNAAQDPANWITFAGSFQGQRFSALDQINRRTVSRLRLRWVYTTRGITGVEAVPLVVDGVMFLTGPDNEVIALDAGTGQPFWVFERPVPTGVKLCCGKNNRGVAVLDKRVYHGTLDNHLIAIDMETGRPVWDVEVADIGDGYSMTGAPLAVKDKVIVGIAGGEFGVRGFVDAYDALTGQRTWRFYTTAGPGEPGHETWENDAWKTGGGATWVTGSFDPELNLLYWGVGNPGPNYDGDYRPGDNLYTSSVIALDPDTGQLQWHFQFVPHDTYDWDSNAVPILADLEYQGATRKLLLWAHRNCFYYILDRKTGEFLQATEYCGQNWNDGFTKEGRPIRRPNTTPTEGGIALRPGPYGGSNWFLPAFSPLTQLYYVSYRSSEYLYSRSRSEYTRGRVFVGGKVEPLPGPRDRAGLLAIHGATGKVAWEFPRRKFTKAGTLATASGLVFTGSDDGALVALDATTGEEIWRQRLGQLLDTGPITYLYQGKQQLAALSSGSLFAFAMPD
jgi:alcohol dehydrogenase (cytochrome c)